MKILIDTNIILDVMCNRKEFVEDSLKVFKCCEVQKLKGYISALSIPNIVYIMRKQLDREQIKGVLATLTSLFSVIDLKESDLIKAAEMNFSDYEDAVQAVSADRIKADYIVTRNVKDYKNSRVSAVTPTDLFARM